MLGAESVYPYRALIADGTLPPVTVYLLAVHVTSQVIMSPYCRWYLASGHCVPLSSARDVTCKILTQNPYCEWVLTSGNCVPLSSTRGVTVNVLLKNPYCGWDLASGHCVPLSSTNDVTGTSFGHMTTYSFKFRNNHILFMSIFSSL